MKTSFSRFTIIVFFILGTLVVIWGGKMLSGWESGVPHGFLYAYGISVTVAMLGVFSIVFFFYRDPYEEALRLQGGSPPTKKAFISIILSVYNEEKFMAQCLDSLLAQTYPRKRIFVVNDASTDRTAEVLQSYADRKEVTILTRKKNVGKKRAIASAIARAPGTIFAFTDSDTVLEKDAIEKLVTVLEARPDVGAVNGHVRAFNADTNFLTKIQDVWYEGQFSIRKSFESIFGSVTCGSGPLAVFRREAIFNYIPAWQRDSFLRKEFRFSTDRSMTNFVLSAGSIGRRLKERHAETFFVRKKDYPERDWSVVYTKSAHAWTIVPDTFSRLVKQQVRWKKSFLRSIFLTGRYFYKRPFPVAVLYYLHVLFVLSAPFIAFRHLVYLPMNGSILPAVLYLAGICYVGLLFGLAYRLTVPGDPRWLYRPVMSVLSTLIFSWLLLYSAFTIKKTLWHRG